MHRTQSQHEKHCRKLFITNKSSKPKSNVYKSLSLSYPYLAVILFHYLSESTPPYRHIQYLWYCTPQPQPQPQPQWPEFEERTINITHQEQSPTVSHEGEEVINELL